MPAVAGLLPRVSRALRSGVIREHWPTATHTPRANLVRRRLDFVARPLLPRIRRPDRCVREDDPLVGHRGPYALRRALHGARPPGLVLVREPDELGLERAHPQLPSVRGSSSSPNQTATSPPTTTG